MASFEQIDETMAHPLYSPNGKDTLEQEPRGKSLSIPHQSTRREYLTSGMDRKACRRTSPGKDPGSKSRNAKRRSSIAVSVMDDGKATHDNDRECSLYFLSVIVVDRERSSAVVRMTRVWPVRIVEVQAIQTVIS